MAVVRSRMWQVEVVSSENQMFELGLFHHCAGGGVQQVYLLEDFTVG